MNPPDWDAEAGMWVDAEVVVDETACPVCGRDSCEGDCQGEPQEPNTEPPTDAYRSPEEEHEHRVLSEMERESIRREARRRLEAKERGSRTEPTGIILTDYLATPDDPLFERIEALQVRDTRVMLVSQFKSGKTTLRDNLVRSLVDGDLFLDRYHVSLTPGRVGIIDTEMAPRQMKRWFRDQRIRSTDQVALYALRGLATSFDIRIPEVRSAWAVRFRQMEISYLILDCLRPVLDALGLDEHKDAGVFLVAFDALLEEAGITEAMVVHHMGHSQERARGDSRLIDWPDATWRLVRQDDDPASSRFFTAYGRDVDVPEQRLEFNPTTRHLAVAGGSRRDEKLRGIVDDIAAVIRGKGALSGRAIKSELRGDHPRDAIDDALTAGVRWGVLVVESGPRNSRLYHLPVSECPGVSGQCPADTEKVSVRVSGGFYEAGHSGHTPGLSFTESVSGRPDTPEVAT